MLLFGQLLSRYNLYSINLFYSILTKFLYILPMKKGNKDFVLPQW